MTWRERAKKLREGPSCLLTKPPKPPFVSFGSDRDGVSAKIPETEPLRIIVKFRLAGGSATGCCTALGRPGLTREEIIADLRERHGARLVEVLP